MKSVNSYSYIVSVNGNKTQPFFYIIYNFILFFDQNILET
jgi:hypothetical protein